MLASVSLEEALRLLKLEHTAVYRLIDDLTDAEMTRLNTIRYGLYADQECSFKDLLAHLVCYEALTLEAIASWRTGEKHWVIDAVDDAGASRNIHYGGIADRARLRLEEQIDEYRQKSAELEKALADSAGRPVAQKSALSDARWRGLGWHDREHHGDAAASHVSPSASAHSRYPTIHQQPTPNLA